MSKLEEFLRTEEPAGAKRKSKLEPFTDNILLLKNKGYTYQQIIEYLKLEGVEVSFTALRSFVVRRNSSENVLNKNNNIKKHAFTEQTEKKQPEESEENINESSASKQEKSSYEEFLEKREKEKAQKTKEDLDSHPNPSWYTSKKKLSDLI